MNQQINKVIANSKNILVIIFAVTFFGVGILTWQDCVVWGDKVKETKEISKDKIIDWKTYSNPEVNFTFKYPPDWEIKEENQYKNAAWQMDAKSKGIHYLFLNRIDDPRPAKRGEKDKFGIAINLPQCAGVQCDYNLAGSNWICLFDKNLEAVKVYDGIRKSFQQIKDVTVNWKTYRNKEFGFEIKYPGNFLVKEVKVDSNRKSEFIIEVVEKKWEKTPIHSPAFYLSIIKTDLSFINWLDEVYDPISETKIKYPKDPPHGYSDVKHSRINNMPVLQFKIWAASGSNDSTLIKKEPNFLYKLDAPHTSNGVFPEDIYNRMLSTFRFFEKSTDTYEKPVNAFNASKQCFIWEFAGDKREYNQNAKLEPVDSSVKFTFLRKGSQLFLCLTSTKVYHSVTYNFTASLKAAKDSINVKLLGIDGSKAIFRALGRARSEIPLPELNDVFELNFEYGSKKDSYKIELINDQYKYTPLKGIFTEINDCIDEKITDGTAKIQRI